MVRHPFFRRHSSSVFVSLFFSLLIFSDTSRAIAGAPLPDREDRSLMIGATVAAEMSSLGEARKQVRASILEKGRNRLSELKKSGLDVAPVQRPPEGFVRIVSQKEIKPGKDARPRFWFEGEMGFLLKSTRTGDRPDTSILDRADLLAVAIWTEKKEYREGQTISLTLQGNRDFYAKVVQIDAQGRILQILPNNYRQISVFKKDRPYRLPDEGDRYQLTVKPPFGTIRFIVYATRLPMSHVNLKTIGGGIYEYRSSLKNFGRSVRRVIPAGEEVSTEFSEVLWQVKTLPRTGAP
jgi:hypothetical protein